MSETKTDVHNLIELVNKAPKPKTDPRALNAYRHGITGRVRFFTTPEDEAAYTKHCKGYANSWNPFGDFEIDLCQMLADIAWRIKTAGMMENAQQAEVLSLPVVRYCEHEQADVALEYSRIWKECGKQLDLLSLYERRLHRNFNETAKLLRETQERRKAEEREKERLAAQAAAIKAQEEAAAKHVAAWHAANPVPKPAKPDPDFDFSKIDAIIAAGTAEYLSPKKAAKVDFSKTAAVSVAPAPAPPRS